MEGSTDAKTEVYHHPHVEVEVEPADEDVVKKYGTGRDMHDMARMGKVQSLRVRLPIELEAFTQLFPAQLRLLFDIRIFHDFDEFMGDSDRVSTAWYCKSPLAELGP